MGGKVETEDRVSFKQRERERERERERDDVKTTMKKEGRTCLSSR